MHRTDANLIAIKRFEPGRAKKKKAGRFKSVGERKAAPKRQDDESRYWRIKNQFKLNKIREGARKGEPKEVRQRCGTSFSSGQIVKRGKRSRKPRARADDPSRTEPYHLELMKEEREKKEDGMMRA